MCWSRGGNRKVRGRARPVQPADGEEIEGGAAALLDAAEIISEAEATAGIADSDVELRPNLEALVASINTDARMPAWGEAITQRALVARTVDRLSGLKWLADHPEIVDETIAAPVCLTGPPRSRGPVCPFADHS